jgi:hypothetical protein
MILAKLLDAMSIDYGCRPSDLVSGGLGALSFDVAVRQKARAE